MSYMQMPRFESTPDKMLDIAQPGIGGLNLKDLEFEQEVGQSPYMLNMMYRNGSFAKRYGQKLLDPGDYGTILSIASFDGNIFFHAGEKIYRYDEATTAEVGSGFTDEQDGLFIVYAQKLYFMIGGTNGGIYEYDETNGFGPMETYIPDRVINCNPDGSYDNESGEVLEDYNIMSDRFSYIYNGTETATDYIVGTYDKANVIDWDAAKINVYVDDNELPRTVTESGVTTVNWTLDTTTEGEEKIVFTNAPGVGDLNVKIVLTMNSTTKEDIGETKEKILSCKFFETFGGSSNSRLFMAGCGNSRYYWSFAYDISYFPETNWARLGNTEEDITGFGRQYNALMIFKPREIYSLISYTQTSSTTIIEEDIGREGFRSQLVNARIGCDAPYSIQLINNLLTWYNSNEGICTLTSTSIQDERNVRVISRNIERTNNYGVPGILDIDEEPQNIQSVDYNNRYFLVFPASGYCFMWDYEISPYTITSRGGEKDPRLLDWFIFDHFYVKQFLKFGKRLLYACSYNDSFDFTDKIVELDDSFRDLPFTDGENEDAIHAYYMTPFMQFGSPSMLKNVKNIYIQCRGDTASTIEPYYYTEESVDAYDEGEAIRLGGKLWAKFQWDNFLYYSVNWANTFRRKCNLKKVQMCAFFFKNDEVGRDMSITHIGLQYQFVKYVR